METGPWITTTTILRELRDKANSRAWERLVGRFRQPLGAFARRSGLSEEDAEDAAQEALIEFSNLYREGRYERGKGRLSSWLFGIGQRCVLRRKQLRARSRDGSVADATAFWDGVADEKDAEEVWNREWERWVWKRCLEKAREEFEPGTLRAFVLVAEGGWSPAAAAEELGVSVKAVYNAKHRVLNRLREIRVELEETQ